MAELWPPVVCVCGCATERAHLEEAIPARLNLYLRRHELLLLRQDFAGEAGRITNRASTLVGTAYSSAPRNPWRGGCDAHAQRFYLRPRSKLFL